MVQTRSGNRSSAIRPAFISLLGLAACAAAQQADSGAETVAVPVADIDSVASVTIANGQLAAKIYIPDAEKGFYRGTRFDHAGVIGGLSFRGHDYYVPWFDAVSPGVRDFEFQQDAVIASPNTAATGPVEEFNGEGGALGYAEAAPGGTFLKIGVGVLRRVDDSDYDRFRSYPLVDAGRRSNAVSGRRADFSQVVDDPASGYGYEYTKTIRLDESMAVMFIEHVLKNTGSKVIDSTVYDHNFLNIDGKGTTRGLELTTPFDIEVEQPPDPELAVISDNKVSYRQKPGQGQRVSARLNGFGTTDDDYDFHIVNHAIGAGLRIRGDRPLQRATLWSIGPVMSIEPFVAMRIEPGETFTWSYRYAFESNSD